MRTLHWYLLRQVLAALGVTVVVFTFVLLIGNLLKEIFALLLNRQATAGVVVEAVGLLVPFVAAFALPMAMLTATLLVFGRFSADQELTAVRASGVSLLSLITPVLLLSLLLCGVSAVVNLEIAPRCRVAYKDLLFKFAAEFSTAQLPEGRPIREFPGYILYLGKHRKDQIQDVMAFRIEQETNVTATFRAPRGQMFLDATNRQLVIELYDVKSVIVQNQRSILGKSSRYPLLIDLNPETKSGRKPRITHLTFAQLRQEIRELEARMHLPVAVPQPGALQEKQQRKELERQRTDLTSPLRVQMHRQAAFSFACFGFTLIGIPLGIRFHRRESNVSFAVAIVLVLVYYSFIVLGQALATRSEWAPHLIVWLPNFIFQAVGGVLLWRVNRGM